MWAARMDTRSTSSCSGGSAWNSATWAEGMVTYTKPGSGSGPRVRRYGWPGAISARSSSAVLTAMTCRRHSTVCPTNRSGVARTSAAVTPTMAAESLGATASAGIQPSICTFTWSPERATTRAGTPAWTTPSVPPSGVAPSGVSRPVWTRSVASAVLLGTTGAADAGRAPWLAACPGRRARFRLRLGRLGCDGLARDPAMPPDPGPPPLLPDPLEQGALAHAAHDRAVGRPAEVLALVRA